MTQGSKKNYVSKKSFHSLLLEYHEEKLRCEQNGLPKNKVSNEIGEIFIKISTNIARRYNFCNYTYNDDMIGDGILNALEAIDSYDPVKYGNPFGYFSRIIFRCFIRRIKKENKQHAAIEQIMFDDDSFVEEEHDEHHLSKDNSYLWYNQ